MWSGRKLASKEKLRNCTRQLCHSLAASQPHVLPCCSSMTAASTPISHHAPESYFVTSMRQCDNHMFYRSTWVSPDIFEIPKKRDREVSSLQIHPHSALLVLRHQSLPCKRVIPTLVVLPLLLLIRYVFHPFQQAMLPLDLLFSLCEMENLE